MQHVISLPAVGIRVSLGQYVNAIRTAKAHPDTEFKHGLTCWYPSTGAQIVRQFREGIHDRINKKGQLDQSGRKWQPLYQGDLIRDRRALQDRLQRRIRVYQFSTPIMRQRFGHLLSSYGEE